MTQHNAGAQTQKNIGEIINSLSKMELDYIIDHLEKTYDRLIPFDVKVEEEENSEGWDDENQEPKTSSHQYVTLDYGFFTAEGVGGKDKNGEWFIPDAEIKLKS